MIQTWNPAVYETVAAFVPEEEIRERTFAEARHYGLLAGVRYGEPFVQKEVGLVDDLTLLAVQSI